jgi:hypothetical protein
MDTLHTFTVKLELSLYIFDTKMNLLNLLTIVIFFSLHSSNYIYVNQYKNVLMLLKLGT